MRKQKQPVFGFNPLELSEAIANASNEDNMIKVVPVGSFPNHHQGAIVITEKEIKEMVANKKKAGTDIMVDIGHDSIWDSSAPAAGWSPAKKMEARKDGLYIEFPIFTDATQPLIDDRQYRYLSPVFWLCRKDKKGKVIGAVFDSIGLVNKPYFDKEIDHVGNSDVFQNDNNNNQNEEENKMLSKIICNFFGLEEGAGLEDLNDVINTEELKDKTFADMAIKNGETNKMSSEIICNFFGLQANATIEDLEAVINTDELKDKTFADMAIKNNDEDEVANLRKDVDKLKAASADGKKEKAEALVNQAIDAGKILPADKEIWLNSALKDYDDTKTKLDAKKSNMPPKLPLGEGVDLGSNQAVANAARELVQKEAKNGNRISFTQAVNRIKGKK